MIVSKKHNFLFLHVPKTGGTSAQEIFYVAIRGDGNYCSIINSTEVTRNGDNLAIGLNAIAAKRHKAPILSIQPFLEQISAKTEGSASLQKHAAVRDVKAFFSEPFYKNCAKAIMVRNPYSRIYSAYKYSIRTESDVPESLVRKGERIVTFEEFVNEERCIRKMAMRPQVEWYDANVENFHVFRMEDFENSMLSIVRDIMNVPPEIVEKVEDALTKQGRLNASTSGPDEWKEMSPEARKRIGELYRKDFETFGYPF